MKKLLFTFFISLGLLVTVFTSLSEARTHFSVSVGVPGFYTEYSDYGYYPYYRRGYYRSHPYRGYYYRRHHRWDYPVKRCYVDYWGDLRCRYY